jgi:hypothetical protein
MTQPVNLVKKVRGANTYTSVIDTQFTELVSPQVTEVTPTITVEQFFENYEQLFFDIPVDGELNSHRYLVERSTQYLGGNLIDAEKQALIEEINSLRSQILEINSSFMTTNNILE